MQRNQRGRGYRGVRPDAKQLSKNRFAQIDSDITSAYDDDDDASAARPLRNGSAGNIINRLALRQSGLDRRLNSAANIKNAEMVNRIVIPRGKRYTLSWVIKQLRQQVEDLKPLLPTVNHKGDVEFFVKDNEVAETLSAVSKRILHRETNTRVIIMVDKVVAPWMKLKKDEVEIINRVVDKRYSNRTIDLSDFANDEEFKKHDMHMVLNKSNVMLAVIDRIDEKYGDITALSLKGNRLRLLDYSSMLVYVAKFVTVLDLSDNQINSMTELEKFKGMPVKTLFFEGNPVCEQLNKSSDYLNAIQLVFPKTTGLDGMEVMAKAGANADEEEDLAEPLLKPGFYGSAEVRQLVEVFIVEFFKQYDGEDPKTTRKNLLDAYDKDNSKFSLSICALPDTKQIWDELHGVYIKQSHNFITQDQFSKFRPMRILRGAMDIAVGLSKLPQTNHYMESFVVDVHLVSQKLLGFTVQGLFEDGKFATGSEIPKLKYFSRSFIVRPSDGGSVAVLSDILYISAILPERVARYKLLINKCIANDAKASQTVVAPQIQAPVPNEALRQQMVEQFCKDSGMLPEWSLKCLEDSNWNYEVAGQQFMAMKDQIPREAFAAV